MLYIFFIVVRRWESKVRRLNKIEQKQNNMCVRYGTVRYCVVHVHGTWCTVHGTRTIPSTVPGTVPVRANIKIHYHHDILFGRQHLYTLKMQSCTYLKCRSGLDLVYQTYNPLTPTYPALPTRVGRTQY